MTSVNNFGEYWQYGVYNANILISLCTLDTDHLNKGLEKRKAICTFNQGCDGHACHSAPRSCWASETSSPTNKPNNHIWKKMLVFYIV